jgi:hypothetical protein
MTYTEFIQLVTEMRTEQRAFFSTRNGQHLTNSKRLEKLVDNALAEGEFYNREPHYEPENEPLELFDDF